MAAAPSSVHPLGLDAYLVKEHVGLFKAANNFDIHDPNTGATLLECREERLGALTRLLRYTDYKRMTPFDIEIREPGGAALVRIRRGVSLFLSTVEVTDADGALLGSFKQRLLSLGGKFDVRDAGGAVLCSLEGKWTGWEFSFGAQGVEFARVTKKWTGFGKEFLTSADSYLLTIDPAIEPGHPLRKLILAAVMCIDMALKE